MTAAIVSTLSSLPFSQLRKNKYFYLYYDGFYAVLFVGLLAAMHYGHWQPLVSHWDNRYFLLLPVIFYFQILCSALIHNATHGNFPKSINRIVGEILGVLVLTRFASWEVIHQRHHRYSDDVEKDPHPVVSSYWLFCWQTIFSVERQLQQISFDLYGDTPERRAFERKRALMSFGTGVLLIACWYTLLGPIGFFAIFLPSQLIGFLQLMHFNWSTHNAFDPEKDFKPVNLDHGFYKIGNIIWFGIYMHANHHKLAKLFNPAKLANSLPVTPPVEKKRLAA